VTSADQPSPGRPDPLSRLDDTTAAVAGLRDLATTVEPLDQVLARLAATAAYAIPDADAVTITLLTGDKPHTAATTDDQVADIDTCQYLAGRGPSLHAAQSGQPVRSVVAEDRIRWPEFTEAAEEAGVRTYLAVPLLLDDAGDDMDELAGSLNVYSRTATAFDPFDERLMALFTTAAAHAVTNAQRWRQSRDTISNLEKALTSRAEIDQAKGALMAIHGVTADTAFGELVRSSQHQNIKLQDIARRLLTSLRRGRR
jgi:GAF domain-containing protein